MWGSEAATTSSLTKSLTVIPQAPHAWHNSAGEATLRVWCCHNDQVIILADRLAVCQAGHREVHVCPLVLQHGCHPHVRVHLHTPHLDITTSSCLSFRTSAWQAPQRECMPCVLSIAGRRLAQLPAEATWRQHESRHSLQQARAMRQHQATAVESRQLKLPSMQGNGV